MDLLPAPCILARLCRPIHLRRPRQQPHLRLRLHHCQELQHLHLVLHLVLHLELRLHLEPTTYLRHPRPSPIRPRPQLLMRQLPALPFSQRRALL